MTTNERDAFGAALARVAALRTSLQACQANPVQLVETHLSWVLLTDTEAYKLKKPLRLPFVDFSTAEARRRFCAEELRLNRRLAPGLYREVVELRDEPGGPVRDTAVRMQRFDDGALWSERVAAGRLTPRDVDRLAQRLAAFHRDAAVAAVDSGFGLPAVQRRVAERLLDGIARWFVSQPEATQAALAWPALRRWVEAECSALAPLFDARLRAGRVRECHGDLHLANLIQLGDEPTAFDAIEFDPELRWIDVVEDIAFVVMDLIAHRESGLAFRFLDTWLADSGDYDGLPVLRYHLVGRALVRALVASIAQAQGRASAPGLGAADYLGLAIRLAEAGEPRLAITHGLPGSGKSFVSQRLLEAAGAIRVRADVERKRMHGLAALESSQARVPGGIYDASTTQRTYARLHEVARSALRAGWPVIVDAAFLRSDERAEFAALAKALGVPFAILDCAAPLPVLRERLVARQAGGGDASEADLAVLELLRSVGEPLSEPEAALALRIDAGAAIDAAALDRRWKGGSAFALGQAARPTPAAQ